MKGGKLRKFEIVALTYFAYATVMMLIRPVNPALQIRTVVVNLAVAGILFWLSHRGNSLGRYLFSVGLILLAYRESGWMALPQTDHSLEKSWIVWDRVLLQTWGLKAFIERFGLLLPGLLELAYLLVYAILPYSVGVFYFYKREKRLEDFLAMLLTGCMATYALYPFFPSQPPRRLWPQEMEPMVGPLLRKLNLFLVNHFGIETSVFPSGHVAAAYTAAFGLLRFLPEAPSRGYVQLSIATLIATATIYGRYHFAVDSLAGLGMALLALAVSSIWSRSPKR